MTINEIDSKCQVSTDSFDRINKEKPTVSSRGEKHLVNGTCPI